MSRETRRVKVHIPRTETITEYTCDGCGKAISRDDHDDSCAHELTVIMDQDQCVNFFRQRDYCPDCLEPVWVAINQLIKADPEAERDKEYDE